MARLLGDADPDLAKRYGLDQFQREMIEEELERMDQRIKLVTFEEQPPRPDGKDDPIAYLPPEYRTYGILDRDHRHRADAGEAWFVEVIARGEAYFLIPLVEFDVGQVGDFLPSVLEQLAAFVAKNHPDALAGALESGGQEKLQELKDANADLRTRLDRAKEALEVERAEVERLEAELKEARNASVQAPVATKTARSTNAKDAAVVPSGDARRAEQVDVAPPTGSPRPGAAAPTAAVASEGLAVREHGNLLESPMLTHAAYDARFTPDLARVHLTPSRTGRACVDGQVEVPGLARVDAEAAPRRYPVRWDEEAHAFVVLVGKGEAGTAGEAE